MTVGELRERLQAFPDFYVVVVEDGADGIEEAEVFDVWPGSCSVVIEADCVGARAARGGC